MAEPVSVIDRLRAFWEAEGAPDLRQFVDSEQSLCFEALAALVSEDQRLRWARGERRTVEDYAAEFPALAADAAIVDAIYAEFLLREELGESPTETEYVGRFSDHAEAIRRQLQLHRALESSASATADAPAPSPDPTTWPRLDGFEVEGIAGSGGMGVVYRARDLRLNRPVAIKMLASRATAGSPETDRLIAEAESAARLQHAGIVRIYQIGHTDGTPYLVMELIDGGTLAETLRAGPLRVVQAVELAADLAQIIQFAHERQVVHRDLKPGNILIDPYGTPRITDFGLARRLDTNATLQIRGQVVGTPRYMAPEQARGEPAGPAADVYALGVMLYEMLSGRAPFQAATPWDVVNQVLTHDPPRLRDLNSSLPRDLETICQKCLHKDPARRYTSAQELREDLHRFATGQPISARPVGPLERAVRWCRRKPRVAALTAAVTFLSIALIVVSTVAVVRIRDARQASRRFEQSAVAARIETLISAAPDAVPIAIERVAELGDQALLPLQQAAQDANLEPAARLHAACGLAALGQPDSAVVASTMLAVPASPGECRNTLNALRTDRQRALEQIELVARQADPDGLTRCATVALFLGSSELAVSLADSRIDPQPRTGFIRSFREWHGDLQIVPVLLESDEHPSLVSTLCLALGHMDPGRITPATRGAIADELRALAAEAPDGATHSSAAWALRTWGATLPVPAIASSDWFHTPSGLRMLRLQPGRFQMGCHEFHRHEDQPQHEVELTQSFFISDCEVTRAQFERFQAARADASSSAESDNAISPTSDHPAQNISWEEAVEFCNWLSRQEGRSVCYTEVPGPARWICDFTANGFRLPTEAEWEYACRAGSRTRYSFGDDDSRVSSYVRTSNNRKVEAVPVRTLMPNAWGLFEMHGNVWEWCSDIHAALPDSRQIDPRGPDSDGNDRPHRVIRGGGVDNARGDADSGARGSVPQDHVSYNVGFRIVCNAEPADTSRPAD